MLRPATDADLDVLRALYATTRADERALVDWSDAAWAAFVGEQFALQHRHVVGEHPDADFLLVTRRGRPVGRLYLDRSRPTWRIVDIALLPEARGTGAGSTLIAWVQRAARRAGAGVDLHVLHANPAAARLYARLGFVDAFSAVPTHRHMVWSAAS